MDLYEKLLALARESAQAISDLSIPTESYNDDNGFSIQGWMFHSFPSYSSEKQLGIGAWRESWGNSAIILTTEGTFFTHAFDGLETEAGQKLSHRLRPTSKAELLNLGNGKPFAKATEILERLPYSLNY